MSDLTAAEKDTLLNAGWALAKQYRLPGFLLWTCNDWMNANGVELRPLPNEKIEVAIRDLGPGFMLPDSQIN